MATKFALAVAAFSAKAKANVDATIRESILGIAIEVIERSPIGDPSLWAHKPAKAYVPGTFKANWVGSLGGINYTTTDETDPSGEVSLVTISAQLPDDPKGIFYITNSLPYAIPLEDGHSKQAPQGIVALTVLEWQNVVSAAALKVVR